jgi:anti-sigma factor RsiW
VTDHLQGLLSAYLDGQVTPPERRQVEAHLAQCDTCRAELEDLRRLTNMLGRLPAQRLPRSFAIGPRQVRPEALSGTAAGYLRALASIAAALAVVAVSLSLAFQGLPRQGPAVAAPAAQVAASAPAPQAAARAAQPAGVAAAVPSAGASAPPIAAAKPAASVAAAPKPAASLPPLAQAPAPQSQAPGTASGATIDVPRLAGELLLLVLALGLAGYSVRWWRR